MAENDNGAQQSKEFDESAYNQPDISSAEDISTISEGDITFGDDTEEGAQQTTEDDTDQEDQGAGATKVNLKTENDQTTDGQDDKTDDSAEDGSETSPESSSTKGGGAPDVSDNATTEQLSDQGNETGDEDTWVYLTEESGIEVSSIDNLVGSLKELRELRSGKGQTQQLSPAMQEALSVEAAGGDLVEHFTRVGMDFEKMDAQEVLRQKFFKDDAKLHKANPRLAQMKFERKLREDYGTYFDYMALTDETEKQDFVEEHGQDEIDYQKMLYESNADDARAELQEWQKTSKPTQRVTSESSEIPSKEQIEALNRQYSEKVEKAWPEFEATSIPIGEGQSDFALGLNDKTRPIVQDWINNPAKFLNAIGIEDGGADPERLLPIMTVIAELAEGNLGGRLKKFILDSTDIETLEKKIDTPPKITKDVKGDAELDEWEQVGEAAAEARKRAEGR